MEGNENKIRKISSCRSAGVSGKALRRAHGGKKGDEPEFIEIARFNCVKNGGKPPGGFK